jgi:DNA mismatch repair ATPase MutS
LTPASIAQLASSFQIGLDASFQGADLVHIQQKLEGGGGAPREIGRLQNTVRLSEVRYSKLLHLVLQGLCLWDLHLSLRLERWRVRSGRFVRSWFETLGEMESLCCLAELADGNPSWTFPILRDSGSPSLVAEQLAHPLLSPDRAVGNDISIDRGRILFVTGSNMSGKSTLLRAVGVNAVLARIGGPVCATSFELTASQIFTYVHVVDSLLGGISTFMAGLLRLKALLETGRQAREEGVSLLFLLDEPLQGTNPAERQVAIRRILRRLMKMKASGVITSHDLSLLDADDLSAVATAVHFSEQLSPQASAERAVFDYRLRPGVCTSTNAIRLLDAIGLPPD